MGVYSTHSAQSVSIRPRLRSRGKRSVSAWKRSAKRVSIRPRLRSRGKRLGACIDAHQLQFQSAPGCGPGGNLRDCGGMPAARFQSAPGCGPGGNLGLWVAYPPRVVSIRPRLRSRGKRCLRTSRPRSTGFNPPPVAVPGETSPRPVSLRSGDCFNPPPVAVPGETPCLLNVINEKDVSIRPRLRSRGKHV